MRRRPPVPPERSRGFAPILGSAPRLLILGSLPGIASLRAAEYYAHPRNLFWDAMGELIGAGREVPYAARVAALQVRGIALWDVIQDATRAGSLDASIVLSDARHNDILSLLGTAPTLKAVAFNGAAAAALFKRRIGAAALALRPDLTYLRLPSTSPANAGLSRIQKLAAWQALSGFVPA